MVSDQEELVDFYDDNGKIIGHCTRQEADDKNYTYPNVIVFLLDSKNRVWIQKRSLTKRHYAGLWDTSACGALAHGEEPVDAAKRELKEEMNIDCELVLAEKFLNVFPSEDGSETRKRMSYIFVGISDDTPTGNHEVEAVAAFSVDELLVEVKQKPEEFIPSFDIELEKAMVAYRKL